MSNLVGQKFEIFGDVNGEPLDNGYIWVGTVSLDAETNQITVYTDAALTTPIPQPIRTNGGYPVYNGAQTEIFIAEADYSITVENKNNSNIYTSLSLNIDSLFAKTDTAQKFTAGQRADVTGLTSGAAIAIELNDSNDFSVTLDTNATLSAPTTLAAAQVGQSGFIDVRQDGTGSRTLAYNAVYKFAGGVAPTLTLTASALDQLVYRVVSTTEVLISSVLDVK